MIPLLIGIPAVLAVLFQFVRNEKARGYIVYAGAGIIMFTTVMFVVQWITAGAQRTDVLPGDRADRPSDDCGGTFS